MSKKKENYTTDDETNTFEEELITYLGPGNLIEGNIVLSDRTIIEGSIIKGKIDSTAKNSELVIGPESEITGEIKSESIVLRGTMRGKIFSKKISIQKSGVFYGEIVTNRGLNVDVGANISAKIRMKKKKRKE